MIGCTTLRADSTPIETNEPITYMAFMPKKLTGLKNSTLEKQIFEFIELFLFIFFIALIPEGVAALLSPSKFDIMFMHIGFNISF